MFKIRGVLAYEEVSARKLFNLKLYGFLIVEFQAVFLEDDVLSPHLRQHDLLRDVRSLTVAEGLALARAFLPPVMALRSS